MGKEEKGIPEKCIEDSFVIYDPDNLSYEKYCVCDIISELPELTPEEIEKFRKE